MSFNEFSLEDDRQIGSQVGQPHSRASAQFTPSVNVLQGPGYKLYQAQTYVNKWKFIIAVFGIICIIYGVLMFIWNFIDVAFMDEPVLEVEGPERFEEIEIEMAQLYCSGIIELAHDLLHILLGYFCLQTSKNPTRETTWILFRRAVFIIIGHFILVGLQFFLVIGAVGNSMEEWQEEIRGRDEEGEYRVRSHTGHEMSFTHNKQNKDNDDAEYDDDYDNRYEGEYDEEDFAQGYTAFIFMIIFTSFAITCAILSCCSTCALGLLYKFHYTSKELAIIQNLPDIRNMQHQPFANPPMPSYQVSHGIARGEVVRMPQIN